MTDDENYVRGGDKLSAKRLDGYSAKRISSVSHRLAATVGKTAAAFAFSAGALCANADTLWSEIQATPAPAALSRALVHVDPSEANARIPANLGTAKNLTFTTPNGDGPDPLPREFGAERSLYFNGWKGSALQLTGFQNDSQSLHVFMVAKGMQPSPSWGGYMGLTGGARFDMREKNGAGVQVYLPGDSQELTKTAMMDGFCAVMEYKIARASDSEITTSGAFHTADATSTTSTKTISCSALNHNTLWLGDRGDGTAANFHMGEFLLFTSNNVPTAAEAEEIALYLRQRWLGMPVAVSGVITIPAGETGHIKDMQALTCGASTVFDVAEGATLFIDCPIVDGAAASTFVKRGAGTLVLTRACSMSGQIVVKAGKLELRDAGALPNAKVNGTLTLGDGTEATFTAAATPLPAALKKAVVWVDPSVTTARIPANLGTKTGNFEPVTAGNPGPEWKAKQFGSLPAWLFNAVTTAPIKFTIENESQSLRIFMVAKGNAKSTSWGGYMALTGGERFTLQDKGGNAIIAYLPDSQTQDIKACDTSKFTAMIEYKIAKETDARILASGAFHVADGTTWTSPKSLACSALNHTLLRLGDRGNNGVASFYMGEFLMFTGNDTITDSEANEVVAYLRKKWLGATELVGDDRDPAVQIAVEAGDTATLNGSAVTELVKTGAGMLKVSGAVSALTVNAGAVEFADDTSTVGVLTLANGAGLVYNGVAGTAETLTVPADATVPVTVGAAVDRHLEEQTVLSFTGGTVAGAFTISEEVAKRWSVKVIGNEVKLLKNSGMVIIVR